MYMYIVIEYCIFIQICVRIVFLTFCFTDFIWLLLLFCMHMNMSIRLHSENMHFECSCLCITMYIYTLEQVSLE